MASLRIADRKDIYVYADWTGMAGPKLIGTLSVEQAKGRKSFSFTCDGGRITSHEGFSKNHSLRWIRFLKYLLNYLSVHLAQQR